MHNGKRDGNDTRIEAAHEGHDEHRKEDRPFVLAVRIALDGIALTLLARTLPIGQGILALEALIGFARHVFGHAIPFLSARSTATKKRGPDELIATVEVPPFGIGTHCLGNADTA